MKSNALHLRQAILCFVFLFGIIGGDWGQTFTDNASSYSGIWSNNSNNSTPTGGFGSWTISPGSSSGVFIGNPSSNGMNTNDIGTTAFGLYATGGAYCNVTKGITGGMQVGDILTFYWVMNYDAGGGSKGFDLKNGNTTIFNVSNGGNATITTSNGTASTGYGTSPMLVTVTRTSSSTYSFSMTKRDGSGTFSTSISNSSTIDLINLYIGNQNDAAGQKNIFFNNFQIQKPDQYRSKTSGNWSSAGSWEVSTNGGSTWSTVASPPGSTMYSTITIVSGHTISQNQLYTAGSNNNIVVESGGILNMTGATGNFQFNSLSVSGSLIRNHATHIYSGAITVNNGGKYIHAINGSSIPNCTWNTGSTLEITGVTNEIPIATGNYQNVIWNCANQATVGDWSVFENNFNTINGNFNLDNTGVGSLIIGNSSIDRSMTVLGDFNISNGFFAIKGGTSSSGNIKLIVNGNFIQSSGTFRPSRRTSASTGTAILELKGNFQQIGGVFENSSISGSGNVAFAKTGIQLFTKTSGTISSEINFIVNNGSILDMGTSILDGSSVTFTLSSGGGLSTENTAGITLSGASGAIQVGGTRTYNTGGSYTFNGSSAQVTGNGFTGAANFTVNNSAGVTLTLNATISGTLSLSSGSLNLGGNTLTLNSGTSAQSIAGSGSNAFNITNGTISLTGTGAHTKTLSNFGTTSSGGLTLGANVTLQMNGNAALDCGGNGTTTSMLTVLGTMQMNSATNSNVASSKPPFYGNSSTLEYKVSYGVADEWKSGTAITTPGVPQNVTINGSSIIVTSPTSERNVKGNLLISVGNFTLNSSIGGDLKVAGNITNNATFTHNNRAVYLNGNSAQSLNGTLNGTTTTNCFPYLFLDNTSGGVTLNTPVNVSNTLTLTTGVVTTTSTNILHILNTSAAAMSGGSSTSYINGPLRWSVSNGSGGDYKFHVGKLTTYLPFNINNPGGTEPVLTVEAFATSVNASPTYGNSLSSVSSSEYWLASNSGTLTSGTISLAKGTIGSLNAVASSTAAAGSYSSLGGSATNTLIASYNTVTAANTSGSLATPTYFVLATKVPAPTISSFTPSTVYVGTTITISGANFTNTSAVSIGGVAASSFSVISATSISAVVAASASSGTISVTTPGGTATSSSSFTFSGYVSTAASDWNSTSTWLGGALPPASSAVTIDHAVTVNGTVANAPSSVTVNNSKALTFGANGAVTANTVTNNGSIIMTAGGTLTIAAGGTLANGSNTFTYGSGTVAFAGSGTITGTVGFNNVTIAGGVNFGTASTINGILSINPGGFVNANAPIYASGSTLNYNAGGTYGRGTEWSSASSGVAGYPHHVQISNGTTLNLGANSGAAIARQIAGNLTVSNGATLSLFETPMTAALTVKGNYLNYGTTLLSSAIGGDLILEGDLIDNATFTANGRAIFFHGSNIQSIFSSDNPLDIDVARFNKSGGEVRLLQNLLIDETANPVQFAGTSTLSLNGYSATFGKANTSSSITMNNNSAIKCTSSSSLTILGNGAFGTVNFDQTTPGTSNQLGSLLIDRSLGSVTMGNNLVISGILTLTNGSLSIGANNLECQNTVTVSSGSLRGGSSSVVIFSGGNSLAELKMDNSTPGTTNLLSALTLSKTGASSAVNITADLIVNGNLSISGNAANTVNSNKKLTVNGNLTNNGELTLNSGATLVQGTSSSLLGSGTYNVKQDVTGSGGATPNGRFWYLGGALLDASSTALLTSSGNQLWQWNESNFNYAVVPSGQALSQGKSYVLRSGQTSETINFSGANLSNGTVTVSGLTRTGTTQNYRGCHLISNPYPSYLDWNAITKTNIGSTMYVRTAVGSTIDVMETFNSVGNIATNNSGTPLTQYIAPMQGFWVKVAADGQTGSLTMDNSMRSHQPTGSGLRSTPQDFPAFLRFNMLDGQNKDQVILLMSPDATMSLDAFDSEKMSASGYAQFYSTVNAKKLVINGMKNVKAKTSVPLTLEMPSSKSYTFQAEEFNIEDGLILLEDKQEGVIQDLTVNPTYTFFSNAGTNATRFVVHFQLASAPVLVGGPQELESLGSDELMSENIQIVSNNQGTVIVRLDEGFKPEGSIRIFDASGRLVEQGNFNDQETTIQLNEQAGMYFVEVAAGKLMVKKKIVIN